MPQSYNNSEEKNLREKYKSTYEFLRKQYDFSSDPDLDKKIDEMLKEIDDAIEEET